jgi:hypothetical protein
MRKLENITDNEIKHDSRLKRFVKNTLLYGGMLLAGAFISQEALAQYNVQVRARLLDKTEQGSPIPNAVISKDDGDVVKLTDVNGDATLTNVGGQMDIKISH